MCQSCIDIDKKVDEQRRALSVATESNEIKRVDKLIAQLYAERVRLHQNPER